jgi:hypothetical protein
MLGDLIAALDDPKVVMSLLAAFDDPDLLVRLTAIAEVSGRSPAEIVASAVREFVDTASDDLWMQLIGLMNSAEDPGLAALKAILVKCLRENRESEMHVLAHQREDTESGSSSKMAPVSAWESSSSRL